VGNFRHAWKDGEEVLLIIEAFKDGREYCAAQDFPLDAGVDIQTITDDITLKPIPEPVSMKDRLSWSRVDNENIIGYSVYRGDERLNDRVIVEGAYQTSGDVDVRLVVRGGYETVNSSQGLQKEPEVQMPKSYAFNLFPNPFVRQIHLEYALPRQTEVEIAIFDVMGRRVKTLAQGVYEAGHYNTVWNVRDDIGRDMAAGVYFVRFEADGCRKYEKVILIR
jgi:hypothetical protein